MRKWGGVGISSVFDVIVLVQIGKPYKVCQKFYQSVLKSVHHVKSNE